MVNTAKKPLNHQKQSATDTLKTTSERVIKKKQKQMVILLIIGLLIKLPKSQKIRNRIIQKQLQIMTITKYLQKELHLQKRDKKLLII